MVPFQRSNFVKFWKIGMFPCANRMGEHWLGATFEDFRFMSHKQVLQKQTFMCTDTPKALTDPTALRRLLECKLY